MAASQPLILALILAAVFFSVEAQQVVRVRGRPRGRAKSFAPVPTVPLVNIFSTLLTVFATYVTLLRVLDLVEKC